MYLTKQKRIKYIEVLNKSIENYYLFIPTAILNESVGLSGFKNKSKEMYNNILELKKTIKELEECYMKKKANL